jgi:hypothetical protein
MKKKLIVLSKTKLKSLVVRAGVKAGVNSEPIAWGK